jgi:hypothetical protein
MKVCAIILVLAVDDGDDVDAMIIMIKNDKGMSYELIFLKVSDWQIDLDLFRFRIGMVCSICFFLIVTVSMSISVEISIHQ